MTPIMDLTWEKGAGPIRVRRPVYVDLLPPCNDACLAGENIQAWLDLAQAGKYRGFWCICGQQSVVGRRGVSSHSCQ
jgi:hypothetical protein